MNRIFSNAIVRLTVLYVIVLAAVCLVFSSFIYTLASSEIDQTSRRQVVGFRGALGRFIIDEVESEKLRKSEADDATARLRSKLLLGNLAVIGLGALLSYKFAKKTLAPVEETLKAQERFTSDASHELRTPLASMRTEIEVALRDPKLSAKDARELLASNLEEVHSLQSMTENLLSLARNRELGEKRIIEIDKLLARVVKKYVSVAKKQKISIVLETEKIKFSSNPTAINQLVSILVENAIKYAGESSEIRVRCTKREGQIVELVVEDDGVGIPEKDRQHIFERFYKSDASRTDSRSMGHGLGLAIAKQLVDALGGSIRAENTKKKQGIAFIITLPLL